jgi:hypothetical protein
MFGRRASVETPQCETPTGDRMVAVKHLRMIIGVAILLFQLVMIGYARFVPARYFCWAPFDIQSDYRIDVKIGDHELTPGEIRRRYRRPRQGTDNRSIQHVMDIVSGVEQTYGRNDHAQVVLKYSVNGKPEQEWRYPQQY